MEETKTCAMCKHEMNVSYFNYNPASRDNRMSYCIDCYRQYQKEWREKRAWRKKMMFGT